MRRMIISIFLTILYGCTQSGGSDLLTKSVEIQHFNIIIAPDLSNRQLTELYPRPLNDEEIVKVIMKNIWPNMLSHRRMDSQRDKISISFINKNLISEYSIDAEKLSIDFEKFETQKSRIDYLKNRSERKFSTDTALFMHEYRKLNASSTKATFGADIWSYFNAGLDDTLIKIQPVEYSISGKHYRNVFRNILILLTDGYIEAAMYGKTGCYDSDLKQCYYLSRNRIKSFRRAFRASGIADLEKYFEMSGQRIIPVNNKILSDLEVLVLEVYDRSVTNGGVATTHPSDLEIIKLFWKDWLSKSGVRRFDIRPILSTKPEAEDVILNFMGISKNTQL